MWPTVVFELGPVSKMRAAATATTIALSLAGMLLQPWQQPAVAREDGKVLPASVLRARLFGSIAGPVSCLVHGGTAFFAVRAGQSQLAAWSLLLAALLPCVIFVSLWSERGTGSPRGGASCFFNATTPSLRPS